MALIHPYDTELVMSMSNMASHAWRRLRCHCFSEEIWKHIVDESIVTRSQTHDTHLRKTKTETEEIYYDFWFNSIQKVVVSNMWDGAAAAGTAVVKEIVVYICVITFLCRYIWICFASNIDTDARASTITWWICRDTRKTAGGDFCRRYHFNVPHTTPEKQCTHAKPKPIPLFDGKVLLLCISCWCRYRHTTQNMIQMNSFCYFLLLLLLFCLRPHLSFKIQWKQFKKSEKKRRKKNCVTNRSENR